MLKIVVPLAGNRPKRVWIRSAPPRELDEIEGQPLLETVVGKLVPDEPHRFVFVIEEQDVRRWAMDDVVQRLAPGCSVIVAPDSPANPVFATLLAVDEIEVNDELLLADSTFAFPGSIASFLAHSRPSNLDGCVATFRCTHPKWNYLREEHGEIMQLVEKRPVSDQAASPVLWLRRAREFFEAAERHATRHFGRTDGQDFLCVVNELALAGRRLGAWRIPNQAQPPQTRPPQAHQAHKPKSSHHFVDS